MSNSIRLSKEHGLNPTLAVCFYCGKETGEIALLGDNYEGEAPTHMCISIEPCDECKAKFADKVVLVEIKDTGKHPEPTGRWITVPRKYVTTPNNGICYMTATGFNELVKNIKEGT